MFGSDPQLSAYVMLTKFGEKAFVLVAKKIVKAYSRTNKYFFYFRELSELLKQLKIISVGHFKVFAGGREKTLLVFAYP